MTIEYMIGQRVIYQNVICTVTADKDKVESIAGKADIKDWDYWIHNPARKYEHGVAAGSLQPLPRGQL